MRKRWLAGLAGASILLFGAVILIRKVQGRAHVVLAFQGQGPSKAKPWRSPADPQMKNDPSPLPPAAEVLPSSTPPDTGDDPVGTVETFLQRSRKEADDSIKALTREAEILRTRLLKVEAALGRWRAIAGALNQDPKSPRVEYPGMTLPAGKYLHDDVQYFEPAPVPKPAGAHDNPPPAGEPTTVLPAEVKPPELPPVPPALPGEPAPPQPLPPAVEPSPTAPGIPPPR